MVPFAQEYINSLLSGGEVPGLFSNEELEGILAPLRDVMASEGFQYASPFDFFTARVKRNLRIILSMDPTNPHYRERCEANPALFTRCSIVWSENWSRTGLEALPAVKLKVCPLYYLCPFLRSQLTIHAVP